MDILAISAIEASLEFLKKGGPFVYPLILCSIAGITAIIFKALSLARSRIVPDRLAAKMDNIATTESEATVREIESGSSALARLGNVAIKHGGKSQEEITRSVEATAREEIVRMHSGIGVLDVVITVAPLLGLLGTASGLVTIFEGLGDTTNQLAISRGIAEALSTTIFGLAIAVPCVVAHSYFTRRIERLTARMEAVMIDFVSACARQNPGSN
ncbi:MAG: MotA/TolQ/ExbB proton channel family protein [Akkermansiaceae bacterium]|jgi:biopolymer transport protein ExbB|nr:MotA/TolQ/ExbB proton channel family protein [Akkermansiaceae bacterium]MDP4645648.1 MotA/TolQ/ExbB proton channel family protein [Akkermansiaceae bacterium]MDP4719895.1 MotA/TolQ/ExbB proton channel family protein [Akkermansiaceae bacterium]MDP4778756.1 MotA/TolQ/ExbB proton channel family protein [Akkermansiaceae bacterium]MDP4847041.1 MotA/TolQ/ExbB proton channel family protein [Akkermansiaceae bacterium]